jgi:hypothetical protein
VLYLAGCTWALVSYLDDSGHQRPAIGSTQSALVFGDDGFVTGNTGCNSLRGSYEVAGDRLSLSTTAPLTPPAGAALTHPRGMYVHLVLP